MKCSCLLFLPPYLALYFSVFYCYLNSIMIVMGCHTIFWLVYSGRNACYNFAYFYIFLWFWWYGLMEWIEMRKWWKSVETTGMLVKRRPIHSWLDRVRSGGELAMHMNWRLEDMPPGIERIGKQLFYKRLKTQSGKARAARLGTLLT